MATYGGQFTLTKLQPWVVAVQDVGMIRMNGGSKHGESEMQLMLNLMIRTNGKGKNAGCIWNSPGMARL
ncbi:hypothetical protein BMT61_25565 [Escherichia coli]|jgi:hypothetical protein|nr:hypothetical protein BMT61_25565 [Escherichia coli]OOI92138.1 hypothetical protein BMT76_25710 [Escherichia coli]OOJ42704.1 hypothetical protein BMT77_25450 [Escherichia coli]